MAIRAFGLATLLLLPATAAAASDERPAGSSEVPEGLDTAAAAKTRVAVLRLRSFVWKAEDLAALNARLSQRLEETGKISLVDPTPSLLEKGATDWLRADSLLYAGIQHYGNLEYDSAIEKLRESADLSQQTWREYGDPLGAQRMRETWFHLGLAHLEQGHDRDAADAFRLAATVDPWFVPDPRSYPPAARAKYDEVRRWLVDRAWPASRETLEPMATRIGADVVISGGVARAESGTEVLEVVIADRWNRRLTVESVTSAGKGKDAMLVAIDESTDRLVSLVLNLQWPPPVPREPRVSARVGYAGAAFQGTRWKGRSGTIPFAYRGDVRAHGIGLGLSPWRGRGWAVETDVALFPSNTLPPDAAQKPYPATTERLVFAGTASAGLVRTFRVGEWGISGGGALAYNLMSVQFQSQEAAFGVNSRWGAPQLTLGAERSFGPAFVQVKVAGEYDGLTKPASWSIRSFASGGMTF